MSITTQIIKSDGAASGDGAVLGTQVWVKQA